MSKNLIFGLKMAKYGKNWPFLAKILKTRIFFKNPLRTFFQSRQHATLGKVSEKSDARISRYRIKDERTNGRTNERTHERESIGPSANAKRPKIRKIHSGVWKLQVKYSQNCKFWPNKTQYDWFPGKSQIQRSLVQNLSKIKQRIKSQGIP